MSQDQKHYAIIMPGLGDHGERFKWLTANWERDFQISPIVHLAGWAIKEKSYKEVLEDLHKLIKRLKKDGNIVSLLGASASGSLAFNGIIAFPNDVSSAVDLCGRLKVGNEPGFRSFKFRTTGVPAFAESVKRFEASIPNLSPQMRQRMLITKGWWDELVPEETMTVKGIQSFRIPLIEHEITISLSVATHPLLGRLAKGKEVIKFIKSQRN